MVKVGYEYTLSVPQHSELASIIHECFCSNRGFATATSLDVVARRPGRLATRSVNILFQVCLLSSRLPLAWRVRGFATNHHE